jgi:hypothetical protein
MAPLVSGPQRRAAIAAAATRLLPNLRIRVVERAWTIAGRTGRVAVCRTFDQLLAEMERHGVPRPLAEARLLRAAGSVANSMDGTP